MMRRRTWMLLVLAGTATPSGAQTFTTLVNFGLPNGTGGERPEGALTQGTDGSLYGTTYIGGTGYWGTVFKTTLKGELTALYNFAVGGGEEPAAGLFLSADGNFYGTTYTGGTSIGGTVFKITPAGALSTLHNFSGLTDGGNPAAGVIQAPNGNFYGTTEFWGTGSCPSYSGCGTVFQMTPEGAVTTLHSFNGSDGAFPLGGLTLGADGNLYGTTSNIYGYSGETSYGTIFKISTSGQLTTLYNFCSQANCTDGYSPYAGLVQASDGNFYGTTYVGGAYDFGTVFRITAGGSFTTLYSFPGGAGGAYPGSALMEATDGNLYGTTEFGGSNQCGPKANCGTIFKLTLGGALTILHSFDGVAGGGPLAALMQDTDGNLYGTASYGGSADGGTLFRLSVGLAPFVKTLPTYGKVGTPIRILGTDLAGATSVTFNGTPARITFVTSTEIKTAVPADATTGKVQVTTPGGSLLSNAPFRVVP